MPREKMALGPKCFMISVPIIDITLQVERLSILFGVFKEHLNAFSTTYPCNLGIITATVSSWLIRERMLWIHSLKFKFYSNRVSSNQLANCILV
jgi:hypothetical protein